MNEAGFIAQVPVRVRWHGWDSDTYRLRSSGWQVFAHEQMVEYAFEKEIRIAVKSPDQGLMIMGYLRLDHRSLFEKDSLLHLLCDRGIDMQNYRPTDRVMIYDNHKFDWTNADSLSPCDGFANVDMSARYQDIRDLKLFQYTETAKEIIIPEHSVDECLNRILTLQYPEQELIKQRNRELVEIKKPIVQAKIYALAA